MWSQQRSKLKAIWTCQICRRNRRIKWECFDCLVFMCQHCLLNVHSEIKTVRRHFIADVDPKQSPIDVGKIPCRNHGNKVCCVYCVKCEEFICPKCLTRSHQRHKFEEIETFKNKRLEYLRDLADVDISTSDTYSDQSDVSSLFTLTEVIRFKIIKTYQTNKSFVDRIAASNDTLFFSCCDSHVLGRININRGRRLDTYNPYYDISVCDMACTESGKLFLTRVGEDYLYCLSDSGIMTICHDFSPLIPLAVHVADEHVIVSTRDNGAKYALTRESRRQIVFLDLNGRKKIRVIENDGYGTPLFCLVCKITTTPKQDIVALDQLKKNGTGRILSICNNNIDWTYSGSPKMITTSKPFVPLDIARTLLGNIVIVEAEHHLLHFLSPSGHLLIMFMTKHLDIARPMSTDVDTEGRMFIGCESYKTRADKAKIYVIEISGC